jgi:hypothetical protein
MKVVGSVNKISEELKKMLPKLEPGQIVTFQMLNGVQNPDPDQNERYKNPMLYGKTQLLTNFTILDPGTKEYVEVGAVETFSGETVTRYKSFVAGFGEHSFQGKFSLRGGNPEDEELYRVLFLSPEREGSMFQKDSEPAKFKILDYVAETKAKASKVDLLRKALVLVANISEEDAKVLWASLNQKSFGDSNSLMGALSEYAKDNYEAVLKAYDDPDKEMKATIREALDKGILVYDYPSSKVSHGKEELTKIDRLEDILIQTAGWFKNSTNGPTVFALVKSELTGSAPPAGGSKKKDPKKETEPAHQE